MRGARPWLVLPFLLGLAGPGHAQGMPDLTVNQDLAAQTVGLELQAFLPNDCVLRPVDVCVGGVGGRKLLRFTMETRNVGTADLVIGDPTTSTQYSFVFSPCHSHYHFVGYSGYELHPRGQATVVAAGHKESFCIEDTHPWSATPAPQHYGCFDMGLTVGWGDRYDRSLDCQWIDVTDVPPGDYDLYVTVNPQQILPESDYNNNAAIVPVSIPAEPLPAAVVTVRPLTDGITALHSGDAVRLRWRRRYLRGRVQLQELWLSRDDGATYELFDMLDSNRRHYDWLVPAVSTTTQARLKVVMWGRTLNRGTGVSPSFTIEPSTAPPAQPANRRLRT